MRRPIFANNYIYHVYNRGVDKRNIFNDDDDYFRFIHDLFEFNDTEAAINDRYGKLHDIRCRVIEGRKQKPRKLLVNLLAFCLMPNHFHLMLEQNTDNGVSQFLRKLGVGYARYFNQKHERSGTLFEGRFKAIMIEQEAHFIHLPYYIHCNPLDLFMPQWREKDISNHNKAFDFIKNYRWSSFSDYIGKKNFPSVTQRDLLLKSFGGEDTYARQTMQWLFQMDLNVVQEVIIE